MGVLYSKCADKEREKLRKPYCDIFRNSPLRFLGYATHLAICSNVLPQKAIVTGQAITTAYILSDVFQKASNSAQRLDSEREVIRKSLDALVWQLLASVIIPGFILSRTRTLTRSLMRKVGGNVCGPNPKFMKYAPCLLGLLLAPFIMKPIDNCVDYIMDNAFREPPKPIPKRNCCNDVKKF